MTDDQFREQAEQFIRANPGHLLADIPEGSGICRIANIDFDHWKPGFLSRRPGRWTNGNRPSNYFADDVQVCAAELGYFDIDPQPDVVVELWETTRDFRAVSVNNLPQPLQIALYEERDPMRKWDKSHILLDILQHTPEYQNEQFIQAPSASGIAFDIGGMCLVAPDSDAVRFIDRHRYDEWMDL